MELVANLEADCKKFESLPFNETESPFRRENFNVFDFVYMLFDV